MMLRFFIMAWLWIVVSFALMWWVQLSVDRVHRGAVEAVERAMEAGRPPVLGARGGEAGVVVQPPAAGVSPPPVDASTAHDVDQHHAHAATGGRVVHFQAGGAHP
jgi:hypothetical protein